MEARLKKIGEIARKHRHLRQIKDLQPLREAPLKQNMIVALQKNQIIHPKMKATGRRERKTMRLQEDPEM